MTEEVTDSVDEEVLVGRDVVLRPVVPEDYGFLHQIASDPSESFRWLLGGQVVNPENFIGILWQGVLTQMTAVLPSTGEPIGHARLTNADMANRHAEVSFSVAKEYRRRRIPAETMSLFIDYAFRTWDFRKLYAYSVEFNFTQFKSGVDKFFQTEGRLVDDQYYDGRYWDTVVIGIHRHFWDQTRERRHRAFRVDGR
ncbi:MAG: GNAT family N-acetyltransferase [bacterium]|nr:GNAT family N-acetyltransferase [bacterium]